MQLNIIHLPERLDRLGLLKKELHEQGILDYKIWNGIVDPIITARGIAQAHKQIVKYAKIIGSPEVLIAEDDLRFTSQGAFDFYLTKKPIEYDLFLGSIYYGTLRDNNMVDDFSGLTFYMISERFYDIFLSIPEHDNLDRSLRNKGEFVVCNPFTVIQYDGFSDNAKKYCSYGDCLRGRTLFGVEK